MRVSLKWFGEFFDFKCKVSEIEKISILKGIEVENITEKISILKNCYSGEIIDLKTLPNGLNLCRIKVKDKIFISLTGAKNVKKGQIVPVALNNSVVYKKSDKTENKGKIPTIIKPVEIDGIISEVMLLSYDEIGIPDDSLNEEQKSGIFILPDDTPIGEDLNDILWLNDTILEIKTYNRSDVLSFYGLAKEFERYGFGEAKKREIPTLDESNLKKSSFVIEIEDYKLCPRYVGIIARNVKIRKSFLNNFRKLLSIGIRPVNNIVDWTNIIMFEYGQPLHAFDLDKIESKVVVRLAKPNEKIITLDGKERELDQDMLLICDAKKPIAIAGVIGGKETEVNNDTKNVFLESAFFSPYSISKTKRKLKIDTEASNRFEKTINIDNVKNLGLMCAFNFECNEIEAPIDIYPNPLLKEDIKLRYDRVRKIIGMNVTNEEIDNSLIKGGFEIKEKNSDFSIFSPKYFRPDIKSEIDLIEEVVRYYGIEKIKYTIPNSLINPYEENDYNKFKKVLRDTLISSGFNEVISLSIVDSNYLDIFKINKKPIEILNPLRNDQNILRTSLIPSILKIIERNIKNGNKNLNLFEIGKIFFIEKDELMEKEEVIVSSTGKIIEKFWKENEKETNFYFLKGVLENLFKELKITEYKILNTNPEFYYHPYVFGKIFVKDKEIGEIGEISNKILKILSIEQKVFVFRIDLDLLFNFSNITKYYKEIPKFPPLSFDISIIVDKEIKADKILEIIKEEAKEILYKVTLFDLYEDEKIGLDKKSLAFNLLFVSNIKTLKDEDIFPIIDKIEKRIKKEVKGIFRKKS